MKRLIHSSCLGLLAILIFGMVAILSVLAVVFQQTQADTSNVVATTDARTTPSPQVVPTLAQSGDSTGDDVMIQIDTPAPNIVPSATTEISPTDTAISPSLSAVTVTGVPHHLGTSSYPLTVTAEVMLGQTHVAGYQAGVAATRTAIASESAAIFATLTAAAPIPTASTP